jgi:hypothetical protein
MRALARVPVFAEQNHMPLTRVALSGQGLSGRAQSFKSGWRRLTSDSQRIEYLWLFRLLPDGDLPLRDWEFSCEVSFRRSSFFLGVDPSRTAVDDRLLSEFSQELATHLLPIYGCSVRRPKAADPMLYLNGMAGPGTDREEAARIAKWGHTYYPEQRYGEILRDVYECNFLAGCHLSMDVGGRTLKDWIVTNSRHGALTQIAHDLFLWRVRLDNVDEIRENLVPLLMKSE